MANTRINSRFLRCIVSLGFLCGAQIPALAQIHGPSVIQYSNEWTFDDHVDSVNFEHVATPAEYNETDTSVLHYTNGSDDFYVHVIYIDGNYWPVAFHGGDWPDVEAGIPYTFASSSFDLAGNFLQVLSYGIAPIREGLAPNFPYDGETFNYICGAGQSTTWGADYPFAIYKSPTRMIRIYYEPAGADTANLTPNYGLMEVYTVNTMQDSGYDPVTNETIPQEYYDNIPPPTPPSEDCCCEETNTALNAILTQLGFIKDIGSGTNTRLDTLITQAGFHTASLQAIQNAVEILPDILNAVSDISTDIFLLQQAVETLNPILEELVALTEEVKQELIANGWLLSDISNTLFNIEDLIGAFSELEPSVKMLVEQITAIPVPTENLRSPIPFSEISPLIERTAFADQMKGQVGGVIGGVPSLIADNSNVLFSTFHNLADTLESEFLSDTPRANPFPVIALTNSLSFDPGTAWEASDFRAFLTLIVSVQLFFSVQAWFQLKCLIRE